MSVAGSACRTRLLVICKCLQYLLLLSYPPWALGESSLVCSVRLLLQFWNFSLDMEIIPRMSRAVYIELKSFGVCDCCNES